MKNLFLKQSVFNFNAAIFAVVVTLMITACAVNPFTGKRTMALVGNDSLMASSATQYKQFLRENKVIKGTPEANMVANAGDRIKKAAEKWAASVGQSNFLKDYQWEFNLIESKEVNAWAMPGGKIVFYTGILPVTKTEAGIAVVMGHEIAHSLLNHGQQRMSAGLIQELGGAGLSVGLGLVGLSPTTQALAMTAYGVGSEIGGTLPFSRKHEFEADEYGLNLMAIAGYGPEEAVVFWERMSSLGGGAPPQFLSTHPSDANRIKNLQSLVPKAKQKAAEFGVKL